MERIMSVEEKIRRAEEIYERRQKGETKPVAKVSVNEKKDIKLLRKIFIQLLICVSIYLVIYVIQNNKYVFSEDFINKLNEILSYDTNFIEIYNGIKNKTVEFWNNNINKNMDNSSNENAIGGADESIKVNEDTNEQENIEQNDKQGTIDNTQENNMQLSQEEQDVINVKNTTTFIKPIEGTITSTYGRRETSTDNIPKNHTGTDIAANLGTKIKSATDGEVVISSEEGDYR